MVKKKIEDEWGEEEEIEKDKRKLITTRTSQNHLFTIYYNTY